MAAVESSGKGAMHSEMVRAVGQAHGSPSQAAGRSRSRFRAGAHARQQVSQVAGGFCLRDVDHMVSHGAIIPSFLVTGFGL